MRKTSRASDKNVLSALASFLFRNELTGVDTDKSAIVYLFPSKHAFQVIRYRIWLLTKTGNKHTPTLLLRLNNINVAFSSFLHDLEEMQAS